MSSLVYTPTIHKKKAARAESSLHCQISPVRAVFFANESKEASTCRREAAALTVRCLPRHSHDD